MKNDDNDRLRRLLKSEEETRKDIEPPPSSSTTASSKKTGSTTPRLNLPDLDKDNMPLPKRVDEVDVEGTRVTPAAYRQNPNQPQAGQRPVYRLPENQVQTTRYQTQTQDSPVNQFINRLQDFFSSIVSKIRNNKKAVRYGCITSLFVL